jgi:hypothetical protein
LNFQITTTFLQSLSSSHYNLQHTKITTISLLIVNFNELNQKDQRKKKKKKTKKEIAWVLLQALAVSPASSSRSRSRFKLPI